MSTITERLDAYCERMRKVNPRYQYGYDIGPRFARVWKKDATGARSALSFVGVEHGTVYRALSWKKRGARVGELA